MRAPYTEYPATIIRAVDGDTLYCELELGFGVLDAPRCAACTHQCARRAKIRWHTYACRLTLASAVSCIPHGCDKYGRVIAEVWLDSGDDGTINLSNYLLEREVVDEYDEHESLGSIFTKEEAVDA
ncbi:MAG: hypothetical protein KatS3mg038_0356 [Candidatus Kapaibacterium sp.]|nr:MAG: hypothetical protein KatS3mg038_0356 [Candidatus Kapabacteria bacterium]